MAMSLRDSLRQLVRLSCQLPIYSFKGTVAVKTLVLGLGNSILTDDGVGIHVVRALAARCRSEALAEASVGGLRLLDAIAGYERVVIVDAIQTHSGKPGDIHRLHPNDLHTSLHSGSTHDLSLSGALALGRGLGMMLPDDEAIVIIAIEVENALTFGEVCTPCVQAAIPRAVQMILKVLQC
jgi:hydrogenase maturation protease